MQGEAATRARLDRPGVDDVLGYVVNLPRTAPFVQQLYAVREAVNRAPVTQAIAGAVFAARREAVFAEVKGAGEDALAFPDHAGAGEQTRAFAALFAPPPRAAVDDAPAPAPLEIFFRRMLAIEVVRRALADDVDVDTGQELRFVQLTPAAPTPILSPSSRFACRSPATARSTAAGGAR